MPISSSNHNNHLPSPKPKSKRKHKIENILKHLTPLTKHSTKPTPNPMLHDPDRMPKVLYHVKRTLIDWHHDPSGAMQFTKITGTFTELSVAKAAARICLFDEGYERAWFKYFDTNVSSLSQMTPPAPWKYGDGVIVHAVAESGEEFIVGIDTVDNPVALDVRPAASSEITVELFHVVQTNIYYNDDRSGGKREALVQGTYLTASEAQEAARKVLLDGDVTKTSFEEYDELNDDQTWEYGDEVVVRAVNSSGTNILVSVLEIPAKQHPLGLSSHPDLMN